MLFFSSSKKQRVSNVDVVMPLSLFFHHNLTGARRREDSLDRRPTGMAHPDQWSRRAREVGIVCVHQDIISQKIMPTRCFCMCRTVRPPRHLSVHMYTDCAHLQQQEVRQTMDSPFLLSFTLHLCISFLISFFLFLSSPSLLLFPLLRLYIDTRKRFTFHIMERTNSLPFGSKSTTLVGKSCRGSINFRFHLYGKPSFVSFSLLFSHNHFGG